MSSGVVVIITVRDPRACVRIACGFLLRILLGVGLVFAIARGMGMGLSICKSIIESHYGRIWLTAGSSRGSVFQFELPTGANVRFVPNADVKTSALR